MRAVMDQSLTPKTQDRQRDRKRDGRDIRAAQSRGWSFLPAYGCTIGSGDKQAPVDCGQMQSISRCVDVLPHLVSLAGRQGPDHDLWKNGRAFRMQTNGEDDAWMLARFPCFPDICFHEISIGRNVILLRGLRRVQIKKISTAARWGALESHHILALKAKGHILKWI